MGNHKNLGGILKNKQVELLIYTSKIVLPQYYCCVFPLYMLIQYYKIRQLRKFYSILVNSTLINHHTKEIDGNYTVLINNKFMKNNINGVLMVKCGNKIFHRYVKLTLSDTLSPDHVEINSSLMFNMMIKFKDSKTDLDVNELNVQITHLSAERIGFAEEVELALVNSPNDIDNTTIDSLIKTYFNKPKLVHESDIIEINIRKCSDSLPCNLSKIINFSNNVYFKCTKILPRIVGGNRIHGYYVVIGTTTIKQAANIQSFIPSYTDIQLRSSYICGFESIKKGIKLCPYGLNNFLNVIEKAVRPFIKKNYDMLPAFLIVGKKGSGKEILISSLASKFGVHFYKVSNFDVAAQVYAQNETKLKNIFFNAKLCAPCILYMKNFEHFEKNNEGKSDERIIAHFTNGLKNLFENNKYPVILVCSSNEENISGRLKREFLQIFRMSPLTEEERVRNLEWLLQYYDLLSDSSVEEVAQKTNGFLFEDLKALVLKAKSYSSIENEQNLDIECFSKALDYMQVHYNESIGAPKVPKVQWDDIGGLGDVKKEIIKTINFPLKHPEMLTSTGLRRFGVLLFGPPGTGKTLLAKAVATECNLCFLSVKGPELLNMYIGQSEGNIREVFERARSASPSIIFFDELDSLAPNRGVSGDSGGVMDRVVSQLLAEMDGLNEKATVFIIGATNRPDLIDPALLRPGRFDQLLYVGPSMDFTSRLAVLKALTRKFHLADDVNLEDIVKGCPENISGADFYGICANSWTHAVRRVIKENEKSDIDIANWTGTDVIVNTHDFKSALSTAKPSIKAEDLKYFEKLRKEISSNI